MHERDNILRIFKETKEAMAREDSKKVGELSNQTTNTASLTHDPDNIAAAVVVYALSKIIEDKKNKKLQKWDKFYSVYTKSIDRIINSIKENDDKAYRKEIETLRAAIVKISGKFKKQIQEVFRDASVNKASRIYDHGISMERTARLLGITLYDLANYIGERDKDKSTSEYPESKTVNVRSRIKLVEDIFE